MSVSKELFIISVNLRKIGEAIGSVDTIQERKIMNAVIKCENALLSIRKEGHNYKRITKEK
jgi:hypothetical protein